MIREAVAQPTVGSTGRATTHLKWTAAARCRGHRDRPTSASTGPDEEGRPPVLQVGTGPTRPGDVARPSSPFRNAVRLHTQCDWVSGVTRGQPCGLVPFAWLAKPGPPGHAMAGRTRQGAGVLPGGVHVRALYVYNPCGADLRGGRGASCWGRPGNCPEKALWTISGSQGRTDDKQNAFCLSCMFP